MEYAAQNLGRSIRKACLLVGLNSTSCQYRPSAKDDQALRQKIRELAERMGYRPDPFLISLAAHSSMTSQAKFQGARNHLVFTADTELFLQFFQVKAHGAFADIQYMADFQGRFSIGTPFQAFGFARREMQHGKLDMLRGIHQVPNGFVEVGRKHVHCAGGMPLVGYRIAPTFRVGNAKKGGFGFSDPNRDADPAADTVAQSILHKILALGRIENLFLPNQRQG